jgi:hypothetical protein
MPEDVASGNPNKATSSGCDLKDSEHSSEVKHSSQAPNSIDSKTPDDLTPPDFYGSDDWEPLAKVHHRLKVQKLVNHPLQALGPNESDFPNEVTTPGSHELEALGHSSEVNHAPQSQESVALEAPKELTPPQSCSPGAGIC